MTGLKLGAVAFLDVLGFKGIWNREKPGAVLNKLHHIKNTATGLQGADHSGTLVCDDGFDHKVKCVSDTVIVTVVPRGRGYNERMLYKAVYSAAWIAGGDHARGFGGGQPHKRLLKRLSISLTPGFREALGNLIPAGERLG